MLENLEPAPAIKQSTLGAVAIEFDGETGTATTPGLKDGQDFTEFLRDAGYDPEHYEVVGVPRTSRWQQRENGEWLTAYRFNFRIKTTLQDLPLLYSRALRTYKRSPIKSAGNKAFVICWSDLQIGKVDHRGGIDAMTHRIEQVKDEVLREIKRVKPSRVIMLDVGDLIENFSNAANLQQLRTNDLSIMNQLDYAITTIYEFLKSIASLVPDVVYASVGSNHCQWRVQKQVVGTPTDDWGVFVGRQLARLAAEKELPVKFYEPHTHDESLTLDVFGHRIGLIHGHQVSRPEGFPDFWRKATFGNLPIASATICVTGHFHHLRVTELGTDADGRSRFWIQSATLDNGSGWYKRTSGEDSQPGLVTFVVEEGKAFTGSVNKIVVE